MLVSLLSCKSSVLCIIKVRDIRQRVVPMLLNAKLLLYPKESWVPCHVFSKPIDHPFKCYFTVFPLPFPFKHFGIHLNCVAYTRMIIFICKWCKIFSLIKYFTKYFFTLWWHKIDFLQLLFFRVKWLSIFFRSLNYVVNIYAFYF